MSVSVLTGIAIPVCVCVCVCVWDISKERSYILFKHRGESSDNTLSPHLFSLLTLTCYQCTHLSSQPWNFLEHTMKVFHSCIYFDILSTFQSWVNCSDSVCTSSQTFFLLQHPNIFCGSLGGCVLLLPSSCRCVVSDNGWVEHIRFDLYFISELLKWLTNSELVPAAGWPEVIIDVRLKVCLLGCFIEEPLQFVSVKQRRNRNVLKVQQTTVCKVIHNDDTLL